MKRALYILLCLLIIAGCGRRPPVRPILLPTERVQFSFEPSFYPSLVIHLERDQNHVVTGEIYRRLEEDPIVIDQRRSFSVAAKVFEELAREIESADSKEATEEFPMAGLDGASYIFTREKGNRHLELNVWSPSVDPSNPSAKVATRLAKRFMEVAGISDFNQVFRDLKRKKPNQTSEPTAPSGRGSP